MSFALRGLIKAGKEIAIGVAKETSSLIVELCSAWEEIKAELSPHRKILLPVFKVLAIFLAVAYPIILFLSFF